MESGSFREGIRILTSTIKLNKSGYTAVMCSERLWFRCHRRFISDELLRLGFRVIHIIDKNRTYVHRGRTTHF
jgi:uncharacterized protein (DUF488 family)